MAGSAGWPAGQLAAGWVASQPDGGLAGPAGWQGAAPEGGRGARLGQMGGQGGLKPDPAWISMDSLGTSEFNELLGFRYSRGFH